MIRMELKQLVGKLVQKMMHVEIVILICLILICHALSLKISFLETHLSKKVDYLWSINFG